MFSEIEDRVMPETIALAAGMMLGMQRFEPLPGNMGIDLRGGNICVPQQQLNHPQVRTVVEQVRREGMSQDVR